MSKNCVSKKLTFSKITWLIKNWPHLSESNFKWVAPSEIKRTQKKFESKSAWRSDSDDHEITEPQQNVNLTKYKSKLEE